MDLIVLFEIPNGRAIRDTYEILGCLIILPIVQDEFFLGLFNRQ